jgi:signal transduction histidine kinase/streptogramin lyase
MVGVLWSGAALAFSTDQSIRQLLHTVWTAREGAPLAINSLAQSTDGYLWMVSGGGLFRFDGIAFERINVPRTPKLSSMRIYRVFGARDGSVWVGFTFGGVGRFKDSHWQFYSPEDGVPPGSPGEFAETPDGMLWVAASGGFGRFNGTRWARIDATMGLPNTMTLPQMFVDSSGTMWIDSTDVIFTRHPGEAQFHPYPHKFSRAGGFAESSTGIIWHDESTQVVPIAKITPPTAVLRKFSQAGPVVDHDGALWVQLDLLRRLPHPERATVGTPVLAPDMPDVYTEADGLTGPAAFSMLVDREGNVWIGTSSGLDRFSKARLEAPLQLVENRRVFETGPELAIASGSDPGSLLVSNNYDAVYVYNDGKLTPILKELISCMLRADDGSVWLGGQKGLWRLQDGRFEAVALPVTSLPVQAMALDKSGALWVSIIRAGVYKLKDGSWSASGAIAALPHGAAITIVRDHEDRLWFSYPGSVVAVLDDTRVHTFGKSAGLDIGTVTANRPAGSNEAWLGGEMGLARYDGERFHTVQSAAELPIVGVSGIAESTNGDLWLNTYTGIVHLAATELEKSRTDPAYAVKGEIIGAFDGLIGVAFQIRPLPTIAGTSDGRLWFSTTAGFYALNPLQTARNSLPPPVLIRGLTTGDRTMEPVQGLRLPTRTTAVRFDFAALSLTAAQKVRYRYRLDGVDRDWRPITAARQALYTNLRPGYYTFRVIAANNDGVWNERGASIAFVIPPAFVQRRAFFVLCAATALLLVWLLVRLRVHQITAGMRHRLEERVAERERIARDLHDTLLQSFHGLLLQFQTAYQLLPTQPLQAKDRLGAAIEHAFEAITEGRDAVQGLRGATLGGGDLASAIKALGDDIAAQGTQKDVSFRVDVSGASPRLVPLVRDEIYRIAGESLRNAFRHSEAKRIEVDLCYDEGEMRLRVRDDGRGIDARFLGAECQAGHYGINGMRERAQLIGGMLEVWTARESGTEIELIVPASRAYALSRAQRRWWLLWMLFGGRTPVES